MSLETGITTALQTVANDMKTKITVSDYATDTVGGTVKMRVDGTDLYIRNDGTNA